MIPLSSTRSGCARPGRARGRRARRLELLLQAGAEQIDVFSDAPSAGLAAGAGVRLRRQLPDQDELAALALVWIVDLPLAEAAPLARAARAAGCLVNVEDVTELCDFHNPAQVRRGDLLLTVSTGGRSPGLAARIRSELARTFGPEWSDRLNRIAASARRGGAPAALSTSSRG